MFLVTLLGVGMVAMQGLRNGGMAISRDSTVVIALYFEVALAFLWTATILKDDLNVYQFVGCVIIVLGSSTVLPMFGVFLEQCHGGTRGLCQLALHLGHLSPFTL